MGDIIIRISPTQLYSHPTLIKVNHIKKLKWKQSIFLKIIKFS